MSVTLARRRFLKLSLASTGGMLLPKDFALAEEQVSLPLHKPVGEAHTICPYCSVGCGLIVATDLEGRIVNAEGDPDHITNRGALDPKSIAVTQLSHSPNRLRKPLYRAPGASEWREMEWGDIVPMVSRRIKSTRDASFEEQEDGVTVNRTRAIAFLGGAANNNEDCYLASKLTRAPQRLVAER
jgi:formate dehydrogenase major subunit